VEAEVEAVEAVEAEVEAEVEGPLMTLALRVSEILLKRVEKYGMISWFPVWITNSG
jgi:hypothetical protein